MEFLKFASLRMPQNTVHGTSCVPCCSETGLLSLLLLSLLLLHIMCTCELLVSRRHGSRIYNSFRCHCCLIQTEKEVISMPKKSRKKRNTSLWGAYIINVFRRYEDDTSDDPHDYIKHRIPLTMVVMRM